jgi:nucleotide-binding universal stress UspA family protein
MSFARILIAVDDSPESMKAARCGFELAHSLRAAVGVLYVVNKHRESINVDLGITLEESRRALKEEANRTIEQFIRMHDGATDVYRFTPEGIPEKVILAVAAEWQADLIVMGTHTRSRLDRILTGSLAEHVIRQAKIPVLVTTPGMK